ncbi:MAG: GNAT family protein [Acidimicrobiales bacterium]
MLPISTDRLTLRAFTPADAPAFAAYRSDPGIARYQSWSTPFTLQQAERFIAEQAHLTGPTPGAWLQIAIDRDGTLVGDVAVHLSDDGRTAEVGCTLAADQHGHGFAREAVTALVADLFARGVGRIEANIDPRNEPSIRLFEHVGFVHHSTVKASAFIKGEWCDDAHYALTRPTT